MDLFLAKKIVSYLLYPYSVSLVLLIAGIGLLVAGRRMCTGRILAVCGLALLLAQSIPLVPNTISHGRRTYYPPVLGTADIPADVRWVVVLSGATIDDPRLPVTSRNVGDTLHRVVEGVILAWRIPDARLLLAGGRVEGSGGKDTVMAELVRELRFPPERIVVESQGRDTEEQTRLIAQIVGKDKLLLVTSLRHMPRSLEMFRGYGLDAVPAPTSYPASSKDTLADLLFPRPGAAAVSASLAHEMMGEAWFKVKSVFK
ncbi:MAG: ElyC/SanA/YdcF family protein [Acidobacteriota bacterium]